MSLEESKQERFQRRSEERFIVASCDVEQVKTIIAALGFEPVCYGKPTVRNIHFTSPQLETPRGGYIRLRKYASEDSLADESFILTPDQQWLLEIKLSEGEKERLQTSFGEAMLLLNESRENLSILLPSSSKLLDEFDDPLVPIASSQWKRTHFISGGTQLKITVDEEIAYFGFKPGDLEAQFMGRQDKSKLEFKGVEEFFDVEKDRILEILQGAVDIKSASDSWHEMEMRQRYAGLFFKN